jgi:hypothetical protein
MPYDNPGHHWLTGVGVLCVLVILAAVVGYFYFNWWMKRQ